jgi:uncharacterized protein
MRAPGRRSYRDGMTVAPVPRDPDARLVWLDAVRGLAVFGILVVNAMLFFWPAEGLALGLPAADHALDRATKALVTFAFEGKFFTVFSLLFGVGLAMQLGGDRPVLRVVRRLLLLAAIGALHVTLAWWGDILLFYGVIGLATVAARRWSPRRLLRGAVVMTLLPIVAVGLLAALASLAPLDGAPNGAVAQGQEAMREGYARDFAAAVEVVRHGSWPEQVAARWSAYGFAAAGTALTGMLALVLAMQWLGMAAWRAGWLDPAARGAWRRVALLALPVALVANAAYLVLSERVDPVALDVGFFLQTIAFVVGAVSGSLVIATGAALAFVDGGPAARALALVGRAALSNYLLQSLVFTVIAYGLGGYARIGWAAALGLTVATFTLQVAASRWWLARWRFGPVEAAWRAATYGRWPAMRR